jgi:mannose-6-phosphate isomerase-like protein (cupin superfamily)
VGPPNILHGFTNTGTEPLLLTSIHGAAEFDTEWLADPDPAWVSRRGG